MAKKNGNGPANGKDPVVTAIHELTAEVSARFGAVEQVLRGHSEQIRALREEARALREETRVGLAEVRGELHTLNGRFANVQEFTGDLYREQKEEVRRLGERVAKLEARTTEPR